MIGNNTYKNDWNRSGVSKCVHAFIGVDKNGEVRIYQTLPWNYKCWGCGTGSKGSYNNSYIQFEICEDALTDQAYFDKAFAAAVWLCQYLMQQYPAIKTENVVSHAEAHTRGYASGHADCDHWLKRFGKNMDWFRSRVKGEAQAAEKQSNPYPVPTYTLYRFRPAMKKEYVRWLQWALNRLGYGLELDGKFGPATLAALKDTQKRFGLEIDGRCGPATRAVLKRV